MNDLEPKVIRLVKGGQRHEVGGVRPDRTLLDFLREDLGCKSVKEGCGEGGCGACAVVTASLDEQGLRYRVVNSCIEFAHAVNGSALWTAEDLVSETGALHPVQQALVECHGSQCGFCTPGFVMSLYGLYRTRQGGAPGVSRDEAIEAISGNLCRCTGYKSIIEAALSIQLPPVREDDDLILSSLRSLRDVSDPVKGSYFAPATLQEVLQKRIEYPEAKLIAGATDVGVAVTKQGEKFLRAIDLSRVPELRRIDRTAEAFVVGASITIHELGNLFEAEWPEFTAYISRFAGSPIRHSATLGGNIANGSPIGDSMPVLIALGASVTMASASSERSCRIEDFYVGYRKSVLKADEVITAVTIPRRTQAFARAYKVSKRYEDDISAVSFAACASVVDGLITSISIGLGGVAATPVRARKTEAFLGGRSWTKNSLVEAGEILRLEFDPLSDQRASREYRQLVMGNLMERFWYETSDASCISLESLTPVRR